MRRKGKKMKFKESANLWYKTKYMKLKPFLLLAILFSISTISRSQFMMMTLDGKKQGKFKAESNRTGYSDKTEVLGYSMEVKSPIDVSSGQSTGKRQYQPITIWKASGASSPQFFQAATTNESISKLTLEFYKPDDTFKKEGLYYTIVLENATITGYQQLMGSPNNPEFQAKTLGMYDQIKIVFQKITVIETKLRTSASDDWNSQTR
jgi:type VI secretion system secreted protein Hcp